MYYTLFSWNLYMSVYVKDSKSKITQKKEQKLLQQHPPPQYSFLKNHTDFTSLTRAEQKSPVSQQTIEFL